LRRNHAGKESEAQGLLSSSDHSSESFPDHQMVDHDDSHSTKMIGFSEELRKLNRDSYAFQNLEVFLSTCVSFLELYPEPVVILDQKGIIKFMNHRFLSWVEYDLDELCNTSFFSSSFFSSVNELTMIKYVLNPKNDHQNTPFEMVFQSKHGQHHTGLLHVNSILNMTDEVIGLIITITDITQLKSEKDEINQLSQFQRSMIENENMWLSVCDLSSNVMIWNKAAERISGFSKEEVMGDNQVWEWLKPDHKADRGLVTTKGFTKIDGTIISEDFETQIKRKDGTVRMISWTPRMFLDQFNNPVGTITIGKDITHQKENEEQIKQQNEELLELNKHLEEKVEERTKKIHLLLDQKNDFINQLGHDLKTPLTPLMALLPIIKQEVERPDKKELVDVLIRNTTYMRDLITKTIELAKLNSDMVPFTFDAVHLFDEVEFIRDNNLPLVKEKQISFLNQVPKDLYVQADKLRLREILLNLFTNAMKYTKEAGGIIEISAHTDDEMVTISVVDNGIGMTSDQLEKIFNEFYKADESRHYLGSTGLGLTISKRLVEKHGGRIWAESDGKGMGSRFFFTIKKAGNPYISE
jgi:PAS domain S-box-containing protein